MINTSFLIKTCTAAVFLAALASAPLSAQTPGSLGGNRGPAMRPLSPPVSAPSKDSILTPAQQQALREANQKREADFRKIQEQMNKLQLEMNKLVSAPKFDEKAVREKAQAFANLQAESMVMRARIFSEAVGPTLTQAQREQLEKQDLTPARPSVPKNPVPSAKP